MSNIILNNLKRFSARDTGVDEKMSNYESVRNFNLVHNSMFLDTTDNSEGLRSNDLSGVLATIKAEDFDALIKPQSIQKIQTVLFDFYNNYIKNETPSAEDLEGTNEFLLSYDSSKNGYVYLDPQTKEFVDVALDGEFRVAEAFREFYIPIQPYIGKTEGNNKVNEREARTDLKMNAGTKADLLTIFIDIYGEFDSIPKEGLTIDSLKGTSQWNNILNKLLDIINKYCKSHKANKVKLDMGNSDNQLLYQQVYHTVYDILAENNDLIANHPSEYQSIIKNITNQLVSLGDVKSFNEKSINKFQQEISDQLFASIEDLQKKYTNTYTATGKPLQKPKDLTDKEVRMLQRQYPVASKVAELKQELFNYINQIGDMGFGEKIQGKYVLDNVQDEEELAQQIYDKYAESIEKYQEGTKELEEYYNQINEYNYKMDDYTDALKAYNKKLKAHEKNPDKSEHPGEPPIPPEEPNIPMDVKEKIKTLEDNKPIIMHTLTEIMSLLEKFTDISSVYEEYDLDKTEVDIYRNLFQEMTQVLRNIKIEQNNFEDAKKALEENIRNGVYTSTQSVVDDVYKLKDITVQIKHQVKNSAGHWTSEYTNETKPLMIIPVANMGGILGRCDNVLKFMRQNPPDASQLNPEWNEALGSDLKDATVSAENDKNWKQVLSEGYKKLHNEIGLISGDNETESMFNNMIKKIYNTESPTTTQQAITGFASALARKVSKWQERMDDKPNGFYSGEPHYDRDRKDDSDKAFGWQHMYSYLGATVWIDAEGNVQKITEDQNLDSLKEMRTADTEGKVFPIQQVSLSTNILKLMENGISSYLNEHFGATQINDLPRLVPNKLEAKQIIKDSINLIPFRIGVGSELTNKYNSDLGVASPLKTTEVFKKFERMLTKWKNVCGLIDTTIQKEAEAKRKEMLENNPNDSSLKNPVMFDNANLWGQLAYNNPVIHEWYNLLFDYVNGTLDSKNSYNLDGDATYRGGKTYGEKLAWLLSTPDATLDKIQELTDKISSSGYIRKAVRSMLNKYLEPEKKTAASSNIIYKRLVR